MPWIIASLFFAWLCWREMRSPWSETHPQPVYWPWLALTLGLAIGCAWVPLGTWRFEGWLARKATILADGKRASVHCNTLFDTMMDPSSSSTGHADPETGRIVLQKPWCSHLRSYLRHPARADADEIFSLALFTHEAMHIRGELNEARTECQAVQRMAKAGELLGVDPVMAQSHARYFFEVIYPRRQFGSYSAAYFSTDCVRDGAWDEKLDHPPW